MDVTSLKILDAKMSIDGLAYLVCVPKVRVREWIYSHHVIGVGTSTTVRGKGLGGPRVYSFADAMTLAASDVLVEKLRMQVTAAAEMIRRDRDLIVKHLLAGQELIGTTDAQDRSPGAVVTIRPLAIYERIQPALASLFPEETAELDRFLASGVSLANATWTKTGAAAAEGRE